MDDVLRSELAAIDSEVARRKRQRQAFADWARQERMAAILRSYDREAAVSIGQSVDDGRPGQATMRVCG